MSTTDQKLQHGATPGDGIRLWRQRYGASYPLTASLLTDGVAHVEGHDISTWEHYPTSAASGLALKALLALPEDVILHAVAQEALVKPLPKGAGLAKVKASAKNASVKPAAKKATAKTAKTASAPPTKVTKQTSKGVDGAC